LFVVIAACGRPTEEGSAGGSAAPAAGAAAAGPAQVIAVRVTDEGYEPSRIEVEAGRPVRLVFHQASDSLCASQVQIPALGVGPTELPEGEETAVEFTPREAGEYALTCGMGMFEGVVIVRTG
jgi:Cu(I)/Ag(I) efflux system membrane fusion protein